MQTVTLEEAQKHLVELVRQLARESEIMITDADQPVARLSPATSRQSLCDIRPQSVGAVLRPFLSSEDDILEELLGSQS